MSAHFEQAIAQLETYRNAQRALKYAAFLRAYADEHFYDTVWAWVVTDYLDDIARVAAGEQSQEFSESEWDV